MNDFFEGLKKILENLPREKLAEIRESYPQANRLRHLCLLRGWLVLDKNNRDLIIIKYTPEVRRLKKLLNKLGAGGIKIYRPSHIKLKKKEE